MSEVEARRLPPIPAFAGFGQPARRGSGVYEPLRGTLPTEALLRVCQFVLPVCAGGGVAGFMMNPKHTGAAVLGLLGMLANLAVLFVHLNGTYDHFYASLSLRAESGGASLRRPSDIL